MGGIIISICMAALLWMPLLCFASDDPLTKQERAWVEAHGGRITIGTLKNIPIYSDVDKNGNPVGIIPDYTKLIEEKLGVTFHSYPGETWSALIDDLYEKKVDVVPGLNYTEARAEKILFTSPYTEAPYTIISKSRDIDDAFLKKAENLRIVIPQKFAVGKFIEQRYPQLRLIEKETIHACIMAVAFDEVDVTFASVAVASHMIDIHDLTALHFSPLPDYKNEHRFGIRRDAPVLRTILDKGIALITEAEHKRIHQKWIHLTPEPFYKNRTFWIISFACIASAFLLMQGIWYWNRKLKKAVAVRTADLERHTQRLRKERDALKEIEWDLKRQESYLNALFESIPDMAWLREPGGKYLHCNQAFVDCFGFSDNELVTLEPAQLTDRKLLAEWEKEDIEILSQPPGYVFRKEENLMTAKGGSILVETVKTGMYDAMKNYTGVLGIARDITKHRQKQAKLKTLGNQMESILLNIKGFIYRVEQVREGPLITSYASPYVEAFTGHTAQEFVDGGVNFYQRFIHPEDSEHLHKALLSALTDGSFWEMQYRIVHKNGSVRWVHGKGTTFYDKAKGIDCQDGFVIDITELREMEEKLHQARKLEAIGILASGIAHDFNNILGGILGFGQILKEDLKRLNYPEKVHKRLDNILLGTKRAEELVLQILEFSKVGKEQSGLLKVNVLIKEVAKLLEATSDPSITVSTMLDEECRVLADSTRFHQLMMNLGTNALYAMRETGGTLIITTERMNLTAEKVQGGAIPGTYLKLSVADNGHGMRDDVMKKILQPFYTTKPEGEGTGMGLWLVSHIVQELKGFMTIDSVVGEGSTFSAFLPVFERGEIEDSSDGRQEELDRLAGNEHILYVDDEKTLTDIADLILTRYGYEVQTFNSPVEALTDFSANPDRYDIVITDLSMPEISGDGLRQQIRAIRPGMNIILTTGFQGETEQKKMFDKVLRKPVSIEKMLKHIREVLDQG